MKRGLALPPDLPEKEVDHFSSFFLNDNNYFHFFSAIPDQDKLNLRRVNKAFHQRVYGLYSKNIPYKTKTQFIIGVNGVFNNDCQINCIANAWCCYGRGVISTSSHPAILYKLKDYKGFKKTESYTMFANGEDLISTGRMYSPFMHTWATNQTWMLARFHVKAVFVLFSELTPGYIMRENYPDTYSAFAREVATAIKVGYEISLTNENRIRLTPPKKEGMLKLTLDEINISDDEIKSNIEKVTNSTKLYK